jgi:hypothetical protein
MTTFPSLATLRKAAHDEAPSSLRFPDGGQYRVEIPSVEGAHIARHVLEVAEREGVPIHRLSQGSGIMLLSDAEISDYAALGASRNVEICLFVGPRAPWDGYSAAAMTPDGKNVGWRNVGLRSLGAALDDVHRAVSLGIRSVLISDEGLAALIQAEKESGTLPADLVVKASALMGIANPIGAALLANTGMTSLNIAADTSIGDLAAYRAATTAFLDLYIEAPDGLGGFLRYHDLGDIVRTASPVYIKFGLRNAAPMYPAGAHTNALVRSTAEERVRRAGLGLEHLARQYPEAVMSPLGADRRGVPQPSGS